MRRPWRRRCMRRPRRRRCTRRPRRRHARRGRRGAATRRRDAGGRWPPQPSRARALLHFEIGRRARRGDQLDRRRRPHECFRVAVRLGAVARLSEVRDRGVNERLRFDLHGGRDRRAALGDRGDERARGVRGPTDLYEEPRRIRWPPRLHVRLGGVLEMPARLEIACSREAPLFLLARFAHVPSPPSVAVSTAGSFAWASASARVMRFSATRRASASSRLPMPRDACSPLRR